MSVSLISHPFLEGAKPGPAEEDESGPVPARSSRRGGDAGERPYSHPPREPAEGPRAGPAPRAPPCAPLPSAPSVSSHRRPRPALRVRPLPAPHPGPRPAPRAPLRPAPCPSAPTPASSAPRPSACAPRPPAPASLRPAPRPQCAPPLRFHSRASTPRPPRPNGARAPPHALVARSPLGPLQSKRRAAGGFGTSGALRLVRVRTGRTLWTRGGSPRPEAGAGLGLRDRSRRLRRQVGARQPGSVSPPR